jgi:hypothetical protein
MLTFMVLEPNVMLDDLGLIPFFLDARDERGAAAQFDDCYAHGGGWRPYKGFSMGRGYELVHDGDPSLRPLAEMWLRDERILVYPYAWVAVIQPDESYEVSRMD